MNLCIIGMHRSKLEDNIYPRFGECVACGHKEKLSRAQQVMAHEVKKMEFRFNAEYNRLKQKYPDLEIELCGYARSV